MGNNDADQQEQTRQERQAIIDALTPEEQHELKMIRENLEKDGTGELGLSFKLAWAEACGLLTTAACTPKAEQVAQFVMPDGSTLNVPEPSGGEALSKAVEQIRERILDNPVFRAFA